MECMNHHLLIDCRQGAWSHWLARYGQSQPYRRTWCLSARAIPFFEHMKFHHGTQVRPPGHREYSSGAVGYILEYILEYIYSTFYLSHSDAVSQQLFGPPTSHPSACVHQANNSLGQSRLDPCPGPQNPKKPERQQRLLHTGTHACDGHHHHHHHT